MSRQVLRGASSRIDRRIVPGGRRSRSLGPLITLAYVLLFAVSCAQIEPPSGGPEDRDPPRVIGTWPDSGAVGVGPVDSLALVFSEPMDRSSVERSFFLSPSVEFRERRWKNETWILRLTEPLDPERTYVGLLGIGAKDRHKLSPKEPWSFAFATGEALETGTATGKVVGQRYSPKGAMIWIWPWDQEPPDTTAEGFPPDPLRFGQADNSGAYSLEYLPRQRALRVCALYDQGGDRRFDPGVDKWACLEEPLIIADTAGIVTGVDLYLAYSDEPGTVAGSVVDSACVISTAGTMLRRIRAERDSLNRWLSGAPPLMEDEFSPELVEDEENRNPLEEFQEAPSLTLEDSLRVGEELLHLDELEASARAESAYCAQPVFVQLLAGDSVLVREEQGKETFRWSDVPPGIYRLRAYRDLDGNGIPGAGEPAARFPHSLEVRPLRVLDRLDLELITSPDADSSRGLETEPPEEP